MNGNDELLSREPCRYCDKMIPADSAFCPVCKRVNPLGPIRCPICKNIVDEDCRICAHCGTSMEMDCPKCGRTVFYEEYCEYCGAKLRGVKIPEERASVGVCLD
ncbi:hypothetical protein CUJ83_06300 [Methanocella sp. CWC-04]|uniref:DZANK-type domain-containing protein n=1 Tax=Methanooceanicella nereidis TaxID=2052831 RepID=A0AAP2REJ5_9EURY|nr:zinc ribbon domain-containing protein [Methanocella sp. CWC-04]MCD1294610.1 hypothetical protein [Methanocella sp. CWC-04]